MWASRRKFRFWKFEFCFYLFQVKENSCTVSFINVWNYFRPKSRTLYHFLWPLCIATWALIRKFRFENVKSYSYLFQDWWKKYDPKYAPFITSFDHCAPQREHWCVQISFWKSQTLSLSLPRQRGFLYDAVYK